MATPSEESYGSALFDIVEHEFLAASDFVKKDGQLIKLECQTDFGLAWVTRLSTTSVTDLLRMEVILEDKSRCVIFADAAHCSFKMSPYTPSASEEKVVTGFGPAKSEARLTR